MSVEIFSIIFPTGSSVSFVAIELVTLVTLYCCDVWWPPRDSVGGYLNKAFVLLINCFTLYNLFSATLSEPGYVQYSWVPERARDRALLEVCHPCNGFKPPRAHHCPKCERCVKRMDQHYLWISNCVGYQNYPNFLYLILTCYTGFLYSTVILGCTLYRAYYREWYLGNNMDPVITLNVFSWVLSVLAFVICAIGQLFLVLMIWKQIKRIKDNQTGIEDIIVQRAHYRRKAEDPPFVYPYNLGWKENLYQVLLWGDNKGEGMTWPVVEGCNQLTLTVEQKEQNEEEHGRSKVYRVVKTFSGRYLTLEHGWRTCFHCPFSFEPRISLQPGDTVVVTEWPGRITRYWMFGERTSLSDESKANGWFPRCCVADIFFLPEYKMLPQITNYSKKIE